jgi:AcrR family transcriptional regulator
VPAPLSIEARNDYRRRLLDVAARLYVQFGRDGLSMRRLAAEFGCSTMALYRWYKNKDEIVVALRTEGFNRMGEALEAAFATRGSARKRHSAVVSAYFAFAKANPNFYRALFDVLFEESTATPELKKARDRLSVPMKAHAELMREENLEVDLQSFATQMWAALHGAILLDDVGLYGADVLGLHEAIIDALIERYRAPADAVKRLRPKGIKK